MKKFGVIFQYELMNYIKNKSYVITTVIIALVAGIIMFVPNFIDIGSVTGENKNDVSDENSGADSDSTILVYDKSGMVTDISFIQNFYHDDAIKKASGENELVDKVKADEVSAGFVVNSLTDYDYYVYNQSMTDDNQVVFTQVMTVLNQMVYCQKNGIDYASLTQAFNPQIDCHENILGKDMGSNYWYCYGLVMIIFMIIIMYGSMVATSVTQEKSNRTMEVLVTSVDTNLLFFAKVLAGAVAALIQSAVMLGTVLISYKINQDKWGGMLNMVLDIPANVLVVFALFGIGGFLFYTFIYGAMGALVSKTEDINKSAGGVQMVIMIVYFITLASLTNVDGIMIKVTSFLPVSSYSAMFARVAMGSVNTWEIVVSFIILVASIVVVGIIGAKIYRMGTLRYGNPIKLSNAFKSIKEN
ncbi:ABC transporter permease [Lachnospira hominis (ex Liu et al. 2021)]|uniref:ABC transporter permease n=1 Tax=Lachnospira hominis (ex Liu et al. 2021) TaxID=2763051 RepID=A0ABR7G298_9FIRM|nr:ABC transporter permease [Lachnospira hominis]MBC5680916.1 ABC transporter permease [Lachnospira hominis]CCX82540.1 sodium transport system permease protein [Eubacterium sp. CAG:86]